MHKFAAIYSHALNSLGIPARIFGVGGMPQGAQPVQGLLLETAEGHATTEIFDSTLNQWVWIDPTLYMLEMDLDAATGNLKVGVIELMRDMAIPLIVGNGMTAQVYDPTNDKTTPRRLDTIPTGDAHSDILRFLEGDAKIYSVEDTTSPNCVALQPCYYFSNEQLLFPANQDIAIQSEQLELKPNPVGDLTINFTGAFQYFLSYDSTSMPQARGSCSATDAWSSTLNSLTVQFASTDQPKTQTRLYCFRANPTALVHPNVEISLHPQALYNQSGQTTNNGFVIVNKRDNLPYSNQLQMSDWIIDQPSAQDIAFAARTWGRLVLPTATPKENARAIAKAIIDALETHRGVPSDAMNAASPFDQYQMAVSGNGRVWGPIIASIFSHACNSLHIPARLWGLGNVSQAPGGYTLALADSHATTEIFDSATNRWVWMDLTFYMLGAEYADYGDVDVLGFVRALNSNSKIGKVQVLEYHPGFSPSPHALTQSSQYGLVSTFYGLTQKFRATRN